jgi:hypothetical protein
MQQEQYFDETFQEFTNPFENPQCFDTALQELGTSCENFIASLIGIHSPTAEKVFRHGTKIKKTNPISSDALRVGAIFFAYEQSKLPKHIRAKPRN